MDAKLLPFLLIAGIVIYRGMRRAFKELLAGIRFRQEHPDLALIYSDHAGSLAEELAKNLTALKLELEYYKRHALRLGVKPFDPTLNSESSSF